MFPVGLRGRGTGRGTGRGRGRGRGTGRRIVSNPLRSARRYRAPISYNLPMSQQRLLTRLANARRNNRLSMAQRMRAVASHAAAVGRLQRSNVAATRIQRAFRAYLQRRSTAAQSPLV